jgi:predicted RNA-binding protein with TRAM domain
MKTGSEFHVGIVGLGSMGMGAALHVSAQVFLPGAQT